MAIWKSGRRIYMGRGLSRKKYERRPTSNMIRQEERLNQALIDAGFKPLHPNGHITVGMASAAKFLERK